MEFKRLLYTDFGRVLISIILGFGLSSLFRKACNDRDCIVFKAENINDYENKIFKEGNKCYKFTSSVDKCSSNKKIVEI